MPHSASSKIAGQNCLAVTSLHGFGGPLAGENSVLGRHSLMCDCLTCMQTCLLAMAPSILSCPAAAALGLQKRVWHPTAARLWCGQLAAPASQVRWPGVATFGRSTFVLLLLLLRLLRLLRLLLRLPPCCMLSRDLRSTLPPPPFPCSCSVWQRDTQGSVEGA